MIHKYFVNISISKAIDFEKFLSIQEMIYEPLGINFTAADAEIVYTMNITPESAIFLKLSYPTSGMFLQE